MPTVRRAPMSWPIPVGIVAAAAALLAALGRPLLCRCGTIRLWGPVGPMQSQMLADWYSFSHLVHGILFFALGWWLLRHHLPGRARFLLALAVEAAWEVAENTPMVIDRYREATVALGYSGDSIVNSLSDIAMMAVGYAAARRLPWPATLALAAVLELVPLLVIRDNLVLNVWMLVWPSDSLLAWQAGAS